MVIPHGRAGELLPQQPEEMRHAGWLSWVGHRWLDWVLTNPMTVEVVWPPRERLVLFFLSHLVAQQLQQYPVPRLSYTVRSADHLQGLNTYVLPPGLIHHGMEATSYCSKIWQESYVFLIACICHNLAGPVQWTGIQLRDLASINS